MKFSTGLFWDFFIRLAALRLIRLLVDCFILGARSRVIFHRKRVPMKMENYFPRAVQKFKAFKRFKQETNFASFFHGRKCFANCNCTVVFNLQIASCGNFTIQTMAQMQNFEWKAAANAAARFQLKNQPEQFNATDVYANTHHRSIRDHH